MSSLEFSSFFRLNFRTPEYKIVMEQPLLLGEAISFKVFGGQDSGEKKEVMSLELRQSLNSHVFLELRQN